MQSSAGASRVPRVQAGKTRGARWIFPDDILWDRTSWYSTDQERADALQTWLNEGALGKARNTAREMARSFALTKTGEDTVVLHEDAVGKIVGNPNRSHGYLYVAAWLK